MDFYAYHGCYPEEQVVGNHFVVDVELCVDMEKPSVSDDISDALNYVGVYEIVKREMAIRAHLLEHLSARILDAILGQYPQIDKAEVSVTKLNPPIGGMMKGVSVTQQRSK